MRKYKTVKGTGYVPEIEKIEIDEKHPVRKLFLAGALLVCGLGIITLALFKLLRGADITEVTPNTAGALHNGSDFTFMYHFGEENRSAVAEKKALNLIYTDALVAAYREFDNDSEYEDMVNLRYINNHPNEELEVSDGLYKALSEAALGDYRYLYLAPLYDIYDNVFYCSQDYETAYYDPSVNSEIAEDFDNILNYATDRNHVRLEICGNNKVCLKVSEDYLMFFDSNELSSYIDLYYVKEAFRLDYIADILCENGYTNGYIESNFGYIRVLPDYDDELSVSMLSRDDKGVLQSEVLPLKAGMTAASLHSFPINERIGECFSYIADDGTVKMPYFSPNLGRFITPENASVNLIRENTQAAILAMEAYTQITAG